MLVALSTSGNSENVLRAVEVARQMGIITVAFTGQGGGKLGAAAEVCIAVPSDKTNEIQEMHIAIGHLVCGLVEETVC